MRYLFLFVLSLLFTMTTFKPVQFNSYNKQTISISVKGCVVNEQIMQIKAYTTIEELLNQIELKPEADLSSVNESMMLLDKDVLNIPCVQQVNKISINTADANLLDTLPGIGLSTAEKIVEYRTTHGLFQQIEDICKVDGIKEAKFAKIKDLICL